MNLPTNVRSTNCEFYDKYLQNSKQKLQLLDMQEKKKSTCFVEHDLSFHTFSYLHTFHLWSLLYNQNNVRFESDKYRLNSCPDILYSFPHKIRCHILILKCYKTYTKCCSEFTKNQRHILLTSIKEINCYLLRLFHKCWRKQTRIMKMNLFGVLNYIS